MGDCPFGCLHFYANKILSPSGLDLMPAITYVTQSQPMRELNFCWFNINCCCFWDVVICDWCCLTVQPGASLDLDIQQAQPCHSCGQGHPFMLLQQGHETTFSLFCDSHLIPCGTSFTEAFDFLFKFFFVFDLKYPCGLVNFFRFFELKVYKIPGRQKTPPSVNEIARMLKL